MTQRRGGLKLEVLAPCNEDWSAMSGGDDIRFCGRCRQNVYNLSEMSESEVRKLVESQVCIRFFARSDGTVVTSRCPPMLRAVRRRVLALAAWVVPLAVGFWGSVACLRTTMGPAKVQHHANLPTQGLGTRVAPPSPPRHHTMGAPPPIKMGKRRPPRGEE
jgi:hypothetical protein